MSTLHQGGNAQPTIDREEHRSFNGINAKAVIPYGIPTQSEMYDYSAPPVYYIGSNNPGAATTDTTWSITKYDLTSSSGASGKIAYNVAWDSRSGATYL